ncbi:tankyrase-1-like protein [Dunaliella salina]|uniref:Tankyrase-1-like protein n=1 Tax=Dunaliella salina TaxID=3046 RepID=A0ABQ7GYT3_DUNSA|nr:tankyrase-1-like protein [Dunaliella salina]|eukprot:KAF5839770.1 tankyrase-1-like protein [Dunaliella salina]
MVSIPNNQAQEDGSDQDEQQQFEWLQQQLAMHQGGGQDEEDWEDPTGGRLTRLLEACEDGKEEEAKAVLEGDMQGFDVNSPGPDGDTALHVASLFGSAQIVQLLLSKGARPDTKNASDGSLAHHDAAASGHLDILKMITEASGPEALKVADSDGETPLHTAARGNHLEVVRWLLEKGACPKATNSEGQTPADEADEEPVVALIRNHQQ